MGTSASSVAVMQRLPFCFADTIAVAVERPSPTTSISNSTGPAPTITARANTAYTERTDFSGKSLGGSDDHLCEHLGALDDLTLVFACWAGLGDEAVLAIRLHVEQVEQCMHRPLLR